MPTSEPVRSRRSVWRAGRPVDVEATWGPLRRGGGDPAWKRRGGWVFRGVRTPMGRGTLAVSSRPDQQEVMCQVWGSDSSNEWLLDRLPMMLGDQDDPSSFTLHHEVLRRPWRSHPGWRVPSTGLVLESLVPAIIEQKVTGLEAFAGQRSLSWRFGEPAPGVGESIGLRVPPSPARLVTIPSWEWLRMGITPQRSRVVVAVARLADRLEECAGSDPEEACKRMRAVPGVGLWTVAEVAQRALGNADAVSFGDYHVAKNIGWALTGTATDDRELADLLAPYRPHRYRVQRLVELGGLSRPRRNPRMSPPKHLPSP
ncbi:MAG: DNA-3-methyladenine glycosylase 2 family protein [Ornithinimicrobium sp.]